MATWREVFKRLGFGITTVLCDPSLSYLFAQPQLKKPNILIIVADDQGYADFSAYGGSPDVHTPNLDRLSEMGTRFTNAYATSPICSPSRAGILTGRYQERWGNRWFQMGGLPASELTLAEFLKRHGYHTIEIGKSHYSDRIDDTRSPEFPTNHGFDEFFGFTDHTHDYFRLSQQDVKAYGEKNARSAHIGPLWRNNRLEDVHGYTTELFTDEAIRYFDRKCDKPFFMMLNYNAVHHPIYQAPEKYLKQFGIEPFSQWDPSKESYDSWQRKWHWMGQFDPNGRKRYLASLACLDDSIGKIIDKLKTENLLEDTLIFYLSDNGGCNNTYAVNTPLSGHKYILAEGGIRVVFAIVWKGHLPACKVENRIISALDIFPTCAAAAGLNLPEKVEFDGTNLIPYLLHKQSTIHPALFWDSGWEWAIRDGDYKLRKVMKRMYFLDHTEEETLLLFDLKHDIGEKKNLVDEMPEKVKQLTEKYESWKSHIQKKEIRVE